MITTMEKRKFIRFSALILAILLAFSTLSFVSCDKDGGAATKLSFSEANSTDEMKALDGKKVSIIGYMSTLSPVNGQFMYLMNMPYQSCPFCVPNTNQLSNTLAVYAKNGKKFEFTDLLIRVEGVLEFGDYTDEYGYEYSYRIKDATYSKVDTSELNEEFLLWQQLAQTGVVADVYAMYDYLHFLCFWGTYSVEFSSGKDYIYASDVKYFLEEDGSQFNYGMKEGYFEGLIERIEAVDKTAFKDLVKNIEKAKALADEARAAYLNGEYEIVKEYSSTFGDGRNQYRMKDHEEYDKRLTEIYKEFANWLSEWEV